jgi:hypothetical protein
MLACWWRAGTPHLTAMVTSSHWGGSSPAAAIRRSASAVAAAAGPPRSDPASDGGPSSSSVQHVHASAQASGLCLKAYWQGTAPYLALEAPAQRLQCCCDAHRCPGGARAAEGWAAIAGRQLQSLQRPGLPLLLMGMVSPLLLCPLLLPPLRLWAASPLGGQTLPRR